MKTLAVVEYACEEVRRELKTSKRTLVTFSPPYFERVDMIFLSVMLVEQNAPPDLAARDIVYQSRSWRPQQIFPHTYFRRGPIGEKSVHDLFK